KNILKSSTPQRFMYGYAFGQQKFFTINCMGCFYISLSLSFDIFPAESNAFNEYVYSVSDLSFLSVNVASTDNVRVKEYQVLRNGEVIDRDKPQNGRTI
ncbi:hypothetical protein ACUODJ_43460, partial [Escherichia sp. HC-CC]